MFKSLDHIAIVVPDTQEALKIWRDKFGFPVLFSEAVNDGTVLLTHLELGNTQLQLVEPLTQDHPLRNWLNIHGTGLHHLCFSVEDMTKSAAEAAERGLPPGEPRPHQGTLGRAALFLDQDAADGVQVELTG
jgi:methylmalonyl-CoA/ethylmalonyl-CoA epimerase